MAILNYTTTIHANKSVAEIQAILAAKGARKVMIEYSPTGGVSAISFSIEVNNRTFEFRLPGNWSGVQKAILKQRKSVSLKHKTEEHAINVCWRIIKDWVEAQMAIIEAQQADLATVFLPYAITHSGNTLSEYIMNRDQNIVGLIS